MKRKANKIKKIVINLFLMMISVYILLLLFSSVLWALDDKPKNGIIDDIRWTWGNEVKQNTLGFREREIPPKSDSFRIMVLGDSFTWGAGLGYEERYTYQLEKILRNDYDKDVEVFNFGFNSGATIHERDALVKHVDEVNPDLIVIGFCVNDPQAKSMDYSEEKEQFRKESITVKFYRLARKIGLGHFMDFLRPIMDKVMAKIGRFPPWWIALDRVYNTETQEWEEFTSALKDIKNISDSRGLVTPVFFSLNHGSKKGLTDYNDPTDEVLQYYLKWYHQAERAAANEKFIVSSIENELKLNPLNVSMCVNKYDCHSSALVNRMYAEKMSLVVLPYVD